MTTPLTRREVALAGHVGDQVTARRGLTADDPRVRAAAIGALERLDLLTAADLDALLGPPGDPDRSVRRRAAEAAARLPDTALAAALDDPDWSVVEMVCWAFGEHETADAATLDRLMDLATDHDEPLVREAAVAALGAIGDERTLPAVVAATRDKAAVRRRAAVALANFEDEAADDALRVLLEDRDWQTRQIAEDLLDERQG